MEMSRANLEGSQNMAPLCTHQEIIFFVFFVDIPLHRPLKQ